MKDVLLSVCIPTYNRWYSIGSVIENVCQQAESSNLIDIVVSDNCSTDSTEALVKQLQKKHKIINFHRNPHNIWPMRNISKVMNLWDWLYLWWLWSDDLICKWWLKKSIDIIKKYNPDIIVHTYLHKNQFKVLKEIHYDSENNMYYFKKQREYLNFLGNQYKYDKTSYNWFLEYLLSVFSVEVVKKEFYQKNINKIIQEKWNDFFDRFNFIHVLCNHYDEVDNWIVLVCDNYLDWDTLKTNYQELNKKVTWTPSFPISKDACYVYNYLLKKYELNDNFIRLRNKNNSYRIISGLTSLPFIKQFKKIMGKLWLLDIVSRVLKKI